MQGVNFGNENMNHWQIMAVVAPIILALYLLITDFVDLFPYNDVVKHNPTVRQSEVINYIIPLIAGLCSWLSYTATNIIAFIFAAIFLCGHIWGWWIPYFFGCSEKRKQNLQAHFGRTIKILPPIKDHPIPNLEHLPVGGLIVIWFITTLVVLFIT